ncbi:putative ribonuclease H-like domain-containing protein [Tanacetum coccineum]|uniref:Ribonuclease H-like domain-containing protein n=1 Tax=Tanacetum coccineum TaxID=301880 RepID=A0ABQ5AAK1_9ASTR
MYLYKLAITLSRLQRSVQFGTHKWYQSQVKVHVELQSDPSHRPSPTTHIPDSIPKISGGNHGGQSSSDKSLSGNEEIGMPSKSRFVEMRVKEDAEVFLKQQFGRILVTNLEGLIKESVENDVKGSTAIILNTANVAFVSENTNQRNGLEMADGHDFNENEKVLQKDRQGILQESIESIEIKIIGGEMLGILEISMGEDQLNVSERSSAKETEELSSTKQDNPKKIFEALKLKVWVCDANAVYRNKKDEKGVVVRNKARLVAQGHRQEEGIYYDEVFAPMARIEAS